METNDNVVLEEDEKNTKKFSPKWVVVTGIILVVTIALLIGLGIYNSPENRMSRKLDLGQKYLEEQNYEQAVVAFNEVIEIDDRCLEAYLGGMEAYAMLGDTENQKALYEKALGKVREFSAEEIEADRENVILLYLEAEAVYAGDDEKILEILQEGYELTGDERLKAKIENLQAKIKEAEKLLIQQKVQEFGHSEMVRLEATYGSVIGGHCYLTYEQMEKEFLPYIELLEKYKELFPDDIFRWKYLCELYYLFGEYDACLDIRKQLHEITGEERYSIEGYSQNNDSGIYTHDKYGRPVKFVGQLWEHWVDDSLAEDEYGENGRLKAVKCSNWNAHLSGSCNTIFTYEYDDNGRVVKETMEDYHVGSEEVCCKKISTYSYDNLEHGYFTMHVCWTGDKCQGEFAEITEYDCDITIDQNGRITYGEPYNEYRNE